MRNPLTGHQIFIDHEKVLDAKSLDIMAGLLRIKVEHPADNPISFDIMASLLHIKMKHSADSTIPCNMSACIII